MGEEAFDETVLAADTGTLTIRGGYGREKVWLGIHAGNEPEGTPEMGIFLTATPAEDAGRGNRQHDFRHRAGHAGAPRRR